LTSCVPNFLTSSTDLEKLSQSTLSAGVDLLTYLFSDDDKRVRSTAIEAYVRRVYRAHRVVDLSVRRVTDAWLVPSHSSSLMSNRRSAPCGRDLTVVPSLDSLSSDLPSILNCLRPSETSRRQRAGGPLNVLHFAVADGEYNRQRVD
jgi:hypothetical protein